MPPVNSLLEQASLSEQANVSNTGGMRNGLMNRFWGKHFGPALLFAVLALFSFTASASAQLVRDLPPPPPPKPTPKPTPVPTPRPLKDDDFDVVRVTSSLVMVPVSVVDLQGEPVLGLQLPDFRLDEEGRTQEITQIGNPDQVPLDIAILFDVSSSVRNKNFFEFQQKAAAAFLRQVMKPADRAAVFTIKDQPAMVLPLGSANAAAATLVSIPAPTSPVATAFYDTVLAAATYLKKNSSDGHRRVILVITDGEDTISNAIRDLSQAEARASLKGEVPSRESQTSMQVRRERAVADVQRAVQQADTAFYSVNPGGPSVRLNLMATRAQNHMQLIAEATGGTAYLPGSEQDLERVFSEVAAELRGQYLIQYYSNSQAAGSQFRRIAVSLPTKPELRVRARQGYYPKTK
jgi:Ca-activated chloride channel family protein